MDSPTEPFNLEENLRWYFHKGSYSDVKLVSKKWWLEVITPYLLITRINDVQDKVLGKFDVD